jgi:pumilio RNA-binding family
MQQIIK